MSKKVDPAEVAAAAVEGPVELENQFVMRLPLEPARALREAIRSGSNNLKERLGIKMEPDMRYGEVRFDHWLLHAKLVDLPSILESLKTIDNKNFYKTADICQLLICSTEEEPPPPPEEEAPKKKKDPNKVDKKYLWPHGITPPLKNVRKRRFRKTLKKKYVEAPEIEKEVKRLLRVDNDAVNVKWEIISEDQLLGPPEPGVEVEDSAPPRPDKEGKRSKKASKAANVAEHDIFGEAVSDSDADDDSNSDEDDTKGIDVLNLDDEDESSRLMMSAGEDSLAPSQDTAGAASTSRGLITQFSKDMFTKQDSMSPSSSPVESTQSSMHFPDVKEGRSARDLEMRAARLRKDLDELYTRREQRQLQQEMGGDNENVALRQRFSEILDETISTKERELQQVLDSM